MALCRRIRSPSLPLLRKLLKFGSISAHGSPVQRSLLCPALNSSEGMNTYIYAILFCRLCSLKIEIRYLCFRLGALETMPSALYIFAVKANALDTVESEILDFFEASNRSEKFSELMKNLSVPRAARVKAVTAVLSEIKFSDVTENLLVVLAENGRLRNLGSIVKKLLELAVAHKGEVKAVVTFVIVGRSVSITKPKPAFIV